MKKERFISIEEVEEAYYECRKNKRRKSTAVAYELNYELNNLQLCEELNNQTYEIGKSITFCVTRPKIREVFAADFRDRIIHHIIMRKFMDIFEEDMIKDTYNCRKGKGVSYGVNRIEEKIKVISNYYTKETYVLRCDISGFFMSIDRDVLWNYIENLIRSKYSDDDIDWWLWLIRKVIYHRPEQHCDIRGDKTIWDKLPKNKSLFWSDGKGLPIGNLTSQIFSNLYMSKFDKFAIKALGDGYGRYVDDFVCISNDKKKLKWFIKAARRFLKKELHITLHPHKIYLQDVMKGVLFIGTYIKPYRRYTSNRTVNNLFELINEWNKDDHPDQERYVQRINSYMGFLIHNNSYGIRWNAWDIIEHKENICSINMRKLKIIKKNELHKDNNSKG